MSAYFSISLTLNLRSDLSELETDLLNYVVNGLGSPPSPFPSHSYFWNRQSVESFVGRYSGSMPDGQFVSRFWSKETRMGSKFSGVTLLLPSIKTPHNWEVLELIDWIASLSSTDGFIGTMVDDFPQQALTLLWVFEGKLFFGRTTGGVEVAAFSTGEKRKVGY